MCSKIKVGIIGCGNVGKGVIKALKKANDMELVEVFSRRRNLKVDELYAKDILEVLNYKDKIDVMILCGGSAVDLPKQGPVFLEHFNTVDSFDTHAKIQDYFQKMKIVGEKCGKLGLISVGWDPGLFSINRLIGEAILPEGNEYTFWGRGVSQGHSDAIRQIEGVKSGIQYTIPKEDVLEKIRNGEELKLSAREKHSRLCFVVLEEFGNKNKVEKAIKEMKDYFLDYDTEVRFISEEEFKRNHSDMPHGGKVIRTGKTGEKNCGKIEFSLDLESNPEFTAGILVAYARAVYRMVKEKRSGAITVFDVPPAYLSIKDGNTLRNELL
ncbi:diaminopimelate dehydrogenase [uncultured Clostridium sp.]|uniref:diaminopimelate dehydrogenase n=1 Tax=uncultured Clostridium sp. TaxID=59620 RepID=UPI0026253DC4|nr:diaminopimelate dehydrogenase [uncultured Clostridium sp.]